MILDYHVSTINLEAETMFGRAALASRGTEHYQLTVSGLIRIYPVTFSGDLKCFSLTAAGALQSLAKDSEAGLDNTLPNPPRPLIHAHDLSVTSRELARSISQLPRPHWTRITDCPP